MDNLNIQSTTAIVEKPSINDWMNEFNVSSRYQIQQLPLNEDSFNINRFKKNIEKGLILVGEPVS
jgi:hypothetical protein